MRMKDLSLRHKMVLGCVLIVLVPLVIVGTITFVNSSRTLEDISKVQTVQIANSLAKMVQLAIERELNFLSATAKDPLIVDCVSRQDYSGLVGKITDLYKKIGTDYEGMAIFDQQGIIRVDAVDKKRVGISVAEREYIKSARQGKMGIGPVNASKATGRPIFGIVAPIMSKDGKYLGCVLGVIKADFLVKHNLSLKLGQTGYAFMVDQQGLTIAHPNPDYILKLDTLTDPELRINSQRMIRGETGTGEYTFRGVKKIIGFAPVELTGWSVAVIQNKSEVMALAYANRNLILMVSGFSLLMTILAVFFLSGTISAPVQKTLTTLNQAIEQATEGIFIVGLDRKVQYANPAMARIVDRPVLDLIGKIPNLENTDMANPEEMWKIIQEGKIWRGRVRGVKKNSSNYTMDLTITPVRDENGKIRCFLAIGKDVAKELMMESQLRQSQKMEAIGTLAGGIAHDFNNMLGSIMGYTELAHMKASDPELERYLDQVLKASDRSKALVAQILTFSRQSSQEKKPLSVTPIFKEVLKLLRSTLPSNIQIRQNFSCPSDVVHADPTQIYQVLMNLCTNAAHAMREEGGILEVTLEPEHIPNLHINYAYNLTQGNYLKLTVRDNGCGMEASTIEHIFEPFFTTKKEGEGTGLGLSVVYGIVKDHGGAIHIASQPDKGTTFTILLPLIEEEVTHRKAAASPIPEGRGRILVVDDEEALAQMSREMLTSLGYEVTLHYSSLDALEAFCKKPQDFDLVITDMTMPNMSGAGLARELLTIRHDIPIILVTGFSESINEEDAKGIGIREFLMKPVSLANLSQTVSKILKLDIAPME